MTTRTWVAALAAVATLVLASAGPASAAPLARQWVFNAWAIEEEVWPSGRGDGVTIAVVGTGIDPIAELGGALLPGTNVSDRRPAVADGRSDLSDDGRGTAMAALIASRGSQTGMLGIAPGVKILPVIVRDDTDHPFTTDLAEGVKWAADHGADIVNVSLVVDGTSFLFGCPSWIGAAVKYALEQGSVVVAAAGDRGRGPNRALYPAACPGVLAVGAVDREAQPWVNSQRQSYVDVASPGVEILTLNADGEVIVGSTTASAAALTSAAVALVWSAYPDLTNRQVVARILATLLGKAPPGVKDPQRGYGTVRPHEAILQDVPLDAPNPVFDEWGTPENPDGPEGASLASRNAASGESDGSNPVPTGIGIGLGIGVAAGLLVVVIVAWVVRQRRQPAPLPAQSFPAGPWPPSQQAPPPWQHQSPGQWPPQGSGPP